MRIRLLVTALVVTASVTAAPPARANHPVMVEGNCDSPVPGTTIVEQGTCGDFDGDGRIGTAEDTDGADRIFGTLNAALGNGTGAAAGAGLNQNGLLLIVASGRFAEQLVITGGTSGPGNVTIEAAPGVDAVIDAVKQGDPAASDVRQNGIGITVQTPATSITTLRNLMIRNFETGILVKAASRVNIDDMRLDHNLDYGIRVSVDARTSITDTEVNGTGFREGLAPDDTPNPGTGIEYTSATRGLIDSTSVTNSFAAGVRIRPGAVVTVSHERLFDNNPNLLNG